MLLIEPRTIKRNSQKVRHGGGGDHGTVESEAKDLRLKVKTLSASESSLKDQVDKLTVAKQNVDKTVAALTERLDVMTKEYEAFKVRYQDMEAQNLVCSRMF